MEHIEQLVIGFIKFGDAGIDRNKREKGYVCHLCTVDENGRFVDLALKKEHMTMIKEGIEAIIEKVEEKDIIRSHMQRKK